jgi:glucan phosphoethanolaminetransferase (alkaline phosphatase superfamily)
MIPLFLPEAKSNKNFLFLLFLNTSFFMPRMLGIQSSIPWMRSASLCTMLLVSAFNILLCSAYFRLYLKSFIGFTVQFRAT